MDLRETVFGNPKEIGDVTVRNQCSISLNQHPNRMKPDRSKL